MKRIKKILQYLGALLVGIALLLIARKPRTAVQRPVDETAPKLDENAEQLKAATAEVEELRQELEDVLKPKGKNEHQDIDSAVADWNEKR